MIPFSLFVFLLVHTSLANVDDPFLETTDSFGSYADDLSDLEDAELEKRSDQYLRFGRSDTHYDEYEQDSDSPRLGKKNQKNDNFIRFGRGGHDSFLRFGRDQNKRVRDSYMRFGRSIQGKDTSKTRAKRDTNQDKLPKRKDAFLRFGKSAKYMRFGRNHMPNSEDRLLMADHQPSPRFLGDAKLSMNSPIVHMLAQLMARREADGKHWEAVP